MKCHVCGKDYMGGEEVYTCSFCDHVYRVYYKDILEFHRNEYRLKFRKSKDEITSDGIILEKFHENRKKIVLNRINIIEKFILPDFTGIDVGAGAGTFAKHLSKKISKIDVQEVSPNLRKECERGGFNTFEEIKNIKNKYDLVFLWHVLEHVENIKELIFDLYRLCKKYFILEIPINRKISKKFDGHLHYFSEKSLNYILSPFFKVVFKSEGVQSPALLYVCSPIKGIKNEN